jgi:hypothetical protein
LEAQAVHLPQAAPHCQGLRIRAAIVLVEVHEGILLGLVALFVVLEKFHLSRPKEKKTSSYLRFRAMFRKIKFIRWV